MSDMDSFRDVALARLEFMKKAQDMVIEEMRRAEDERLANERRRREEYEASLGPNRKPNWKSAPEWANWLAMNCIGTWYWSSHSPRWDWFFGDHFWSCRREEAGQADEWSRSTAKRSLESRP